ncbi:Uncharacterized protein dnm_047900 [Desulfonema magnum]|uniref:Uncharacterized protein n=1 Tax=Desulfonema magnum TaxID=45655 RepID=A0A975BP27_9BACT|nr:Uncharacterized protein dnm_047900 [Desulfonema magnum]
MDRFKFSACVRNHKIRQHQKYFDIRKEFWHSVTVSVNFFKKGV